MQTTTPPDNHGRSHKVDAGHVRALLPSPAGLAWTACALALALVVCAFVLAIVDRSTEVYEYLFALVLVAYALVGSLIATRLPGNPVGWFFLGIAVSLALGVPAFAYATYGLITNPGSLPAAGAMAWLLSWHFVPGLFLLLSFLPLYFPDGRLPSRRWRWVVRSSFFVAAVMTIYNALRPGEIKDLGLINPLGVEALRPAVTLLDTVTFVAIFVVFFVSAASLVVRYRRSGHQERQQIKWLAYAVAAIPVWFLVNPPIEEISRLLFSVVENLLFAGIPVAVGIAVLKHRLYDIDLIINRTLVYGALTACVVALYVLVVGYLGAAFQTQDNLAVSLLATGLVAVLFQPLRDRLQRGVNRLMYGERDDPYAVISRLGERLESALAPDAVLTTLVETVREVLKLPYAAIALSRGGAYEISATAGELVASPLRLPLRYGNEQVGELLLGLRAGEEGFSEADRRLFGDLARQAGVAVHAVRLTADLQRSRERLVTAREEERRRLRRDLHDGLGAQLAGLNVQAGVLRRLIPHDPETADELVVELRNELRAAIGDIRRLVYDLRPPALDDLGLVAALERLAERYGAEDEGLRIVVEAPDGEALPPLPAAVEVAVYRIAQEALTNVVRHAGAQECVVRLAVSNGLELEITDDGQGMAKEPGIGVGLLSMRERTAELGGDFAVEPVPEGGTRIAVRLPLTEG